MSTPESDPAIDPSVAEDFARLLNWPPDPFIPADRRTGGRLNDGLTPMNPKWSMSVADGDSERQDRHRALDDVECAKREARESALHEAAMVHDIEGQECFRGEEVDKVIQTAKRFYEYLWTGK